MNKGEFESFIVRLDRIEVLLEDIARNLAPPQVTTTRRKQQKRTEPAQTPDRPGRNTIKQRVRKDAAEALDDVLTGS